MTLGERQRAASTKLFFELRSKGVKVTSTSLPVNLGRPAIRVGLEEATTVSLPNTYPLPNDDGTPSTEHIEIIYTISGAAFAFL
jgi:hypothetical protein